MFVHGRRCSYYYILYTIVMILFLLYYVGHNCSTNKKMGDKEKTIVSQCMIIQHACMTLVRRFTFIHCMYIGILHNLQSAGSHMVVRVLSGMN